MPDDPTDLPDPSTQDGAAPPPEPARPFGTWGVAALGALAAAVAWLLSAGLMWAYANGHLPARLAMRLTATFLPMPVGLRPGPVAGGLAVVAALVLLLAAGVVRAARRGTVSATAVLLAGWLVACVAGVAGAATCTAGVASPFGAVVSSRWIVSQGATWGVVWGWAVGVALVLALRRGRSAPPDDARSSVPAPVGSAGRVGVRPGSVVAGIVAGVVAAAGWAVSGWVLAWVTTEVGTSTQARWEATQWALALLPNSAGPDLAWFGAPYVRAYLLGAALLGAAVAGAVVLAARGTASRRGGGVLVLVAWWASIVGGMVATGVAAAQGGTHLQDAGGLDAVGLLSLYIGSSVWQASGWGLMYGWIVGLLAWLVLRLVDRAPAPVGEPPAPSADVPAAASV